MNFHFYFKLEKALRKKRQNVTSPQVIANELKHFLITIGKLSFSKMIFQEFSNKRNFCTILFLLMFLDYYPTIFIDFLKAQFC